MVGNVEARYRNQTEVQNRFNAFEDKSEDAKEVEEETTEPFISPKAKKEAFWIRSQAKEKEAKKKAKEEDELMESLIGANMVHDTATPPTRTSPHHRLQQFPRL